MKKNVDDYFNSLISRVSKAEKEKEVADYTKSKTIEEKKEILLPIGNLFLKIREAGITVYPFEYLLQSQTIKDTMSPIPFKYFLKETNRDLKYDFIHPSPLIVINDPVKIEIGVINQIFREEEGLISITCGKTHPNQDILNKKFFNVDDAIEAILDFIAKNTIAIERNRSKD